MRIGPFDYTTRFVLVQIEDIRLVKLMFILKWGCVLSLIFTEHCASELLS